MQTKFKAIFTIIGTVIGAGFASGQEIFSFFNIYGKKGLWGIILANILTGIIIYKVLKISNKMEIKSYKNLLEKTNLSKNKITIFNLIINMFLLLSFYIMIAGFATYFNQEFNIPKILIIIIISAIAYITFNKKIEGITKINNIIIPLLIFIICVMGLKIGIIGNINDLENTNNENNILWLIKSIEYASYNSILLIPMLISIKEISKNQEKKISVISAVILLILSSVLFFILYKMNKLVDIRKIEMPMVYIANTFGIVYKNIYGLVIIFSIYSTMTSAGYGLLENLGKKKYKFYNKLICITSILVSNISFSKLINITYPVFGILGIIQLFYLFRIK